MPAAANMRGRNTKYKEGCPSRRSAGGILLFLGLHFLHFRRGSPLRRLASLGRLFCFLRLLLCLSLGLCLDAFLKIRGEISKQTTKKIVARAPWELPHPRLQSQLRSSAASAFSPL